MNLTPEKISALVSELEKISNKDTLDEQGRFEILLDCDTGYAFDLGIDDGKIFLARELLRIIQ